MESLESPNYFDYDMKQDFHVAFAKREATRIVKHIEHHKKVTLLERHVSNKYTKAIVGS
ncbi:MAG: hypothetical protein ACXAE3_07255 [Candidatus Kariarchaeaceae archaeon]